LVQFFSVAEFLPLLLAIEMILPFAAQVKEDVTNCGLEN
jgi:hypothetical protein